MMIKKCRIEELISILPFAFVVLFLQWCHRHIFDNIHSISGWNCCFPGRISSASRRLCAINVSCVFFYMVMKLNPTNRCNFIRFFVKTAIEATKYSSNTLIKWLTWILWFIPTEDNGQKSVHQKWNPWEYLKWLNRAIKTTPFIK